MHYSLLYEFLYWSTHKLLIDISDPHHSRNSHENTNSDLFKARIHSLSRYNNHYLVKCGRNSTSLLQNSYNRLIPVVLSLPSKYLHASCTHNVIVIRYFLCYCGKGVCSVWRLWRWYHFIRSGIFASAIYCTRLWRESCVSSHFAWLFL